MIEDKVKSSMASSMLTQKLQLSVFENKLSSQIDNLDSSDVKDVGEACNELDDVRQAIQNTEAEIKQLKDREYQLENEVIPSFFERSGVSAITLTDGSKVSIKDRLRANITDENEDYCYDKLRELGLGDVIKNKVELIFGKGQDSDASNLMTELQDRAHIQIVNVFVLRDEVTFVKKRKIQIFFGK